MRVEGEYTGGHCHTYNPTTHSLADEGFYAMLGTCNTILSLNYRHQQVCLTLGWSSVVFALGLLIEKNNDL